mmetsp:Transcript_125293/g.315620  ORF Transcript_125293/g.315620 Transcript_125293/m.315620 type:complete len:317 (+) Transcript_125293:687-1637(+)
MLVGLRLERRFGFSSSAGVFVGLRLERRFTLSSSAGTLVGLRLERRFESAASFGSLIGKSLLVGLGSRFSSGDALLAMHWGFSSELQPPPMSLPASKPLLLFRPDFEAAPALASTDVLLALRWVSSSSKPRPLPASLSGPALLLLFRRGLADTSKASSVDLVLALRWELFSKLLSLLFSVLLSKLLLLRRRDFEGTRSSLLLLRRDFLPLSFEFTLACDFFSSSSTANLALAASPGVRPTDLTANSTTATKPSSSSGDFDVLAAVDKRSLNSSLDTRPSASEKRSNNLPASPPKPRFSAHLMNLLREIDPLPSAKP